MAFLVRKLKRTFKFQVLEKFHSFEAFIIEPDVNSIE